MCMYGVLFGDVILCLCMGFCVETLVGVYVWRSVWKWKLVCMYGVLFEDLSWCACMAFCVEM